MRRVIDRLLMCCARIYATHLFACSNDAAVFAYGKRSLANDRVRIVRNGVELDKFIFNPQARTKVRSELNYTDEWVIGTVCRLTTPKNLGFLIEIFHAVLQQRANARLMIVGEGADRTLIEAQVLKLGIGSFVQLVGRKSAIWDYYSAMDLFVAPSLWEGFPGTAIEAQAAALPGVVSMAFPPESVLSDRFRRLSIEEKPTVWADEIIGMEGKRDRSSTVAHLRNGGYDAAQTAKELECFYRAQQL